MNKTIFNVPRGIQYISEWTDYDLPRGHCIVDKGVTGCGYTEYTLTNKDNVVLCSPRKLLLENKSEQHQGDRNILYLKNEILDINNVSDLRIKVRSHILSCNELGLPVKFMITYDSTHYLVDILKEMGLLEEFYFIIDEFQSIFLDSFFKSNVELDFVEYLQDCPNVLYLSATPMLDKYLEKMNEFKDLDFYHLDWENSGLIENIILQRKFTRSLGGECVKVINTYLSGNYPLTFVGDKLYTSKEAVFYFNSISDIIRVINKTGLTSEQTNIICANTTENRSKLKKIGHNIGRIPLKSETNKMFTFCTKTAYIGADFHSECASTFVFADPNIKSLALDISLDLPQIVGRQRNKENPFKNNVVVFYKTLRKDNIMSREEFDNLQETRRDSTQKLLDGYNKLSPEERKEYLRKIRDGIVVSGYSDDFVGISKKTGKPVYNTLIDLADERAWEVSQKDYQDKISVTKSLESISQEVSEYLSDLEKEVQEFLDNQFYKTGLFHEKMRIYCEFLDHHRLHLEEIYSLLDPKIGNPEFKKYYSYYGTSGCSTKKYIRSYLEQGMRNLTKEYELSEKIYQRFKPDTRYTLKEIKSILQGLYDDLGIKAKAKASDLGKYFKLIPVKFTTSNKTLENGFRIDSKKSNI